MKVLFITTIPSPYRVAFFNELGKLVELTVLFEKAGSDERDQSWKNYRFDNFQGIIMNGMKTSVNTAFCPEVCKYLSRQWDRIVCCNVATLTGMLAIQTMRQRKLSYWIEGDGAFAKNGKGFKEKVKRYFISGANGYFSTSEEHDKYYLAYGGDRSKIHRYPFTSISKQYIENAQICDGFRQEHVKSRSILREYSRNKISAEEEIVVLTVGQFIHRKGFDILLKAASKLPKNIGFYFVGGEPSGEYIAIQKQYNLYNVHFVGFKESLELSDYYRAADFFVLPTREDIWGLVINEAMAHSLPIITTDKCIAGLELVKNGKNGFIVPANSVSHLRSAIIKLANNRKVREQFGMKSLDIIRGYTVEAMAEAHFQILNEER